MIQKDARKSPSRARSIKNRLGMEAYEHYKLTGEYDSALLAVDLVIEPLPPHPGNGEDLYPLTEIRDRTGTAVAYSMSDNRTREIMTKIPNATAHNIWVSNRTINLNIGGQQLTGLALWTAHDVSTAHYLAETDKVAPSQVDE